MKRGISKILLVLACLFLLGALTGCYFESQVQEQIRQAELQRQDELEVLEDQRVAIEQEKEATELQFVHRLERLEVRQANTFKRHEQLREQEARDLNVAQSKDNLFLGGISSLLTLTGVGGVGIPVALRKFRANWQAGQRNGVENLRDAIAAARATDPEFDKVFAGKAGQVLKSRLPDDIQNIIREGRKHRPVEVA